MKPREGIVLVVGLLCVLAVAIFLAFPPVSVVDPGEYNRTSVSISDQNGTQLTTVDVRIADSREKRRVGLMRTDDLANGSGMLFVHPREGSFTYHMRNMSFDIDMIFIDTNGTVTTVHHASAPGPDGSSDTYTGRGQYVLEVPSGFANETGIDAGDRIDIPPGLP